MPKTNAETEPIRQSVVVDCPIEDAFELFTARLGEWWPRSINDDLAIEPRRDGRVFKRTGGEERELGRVTEWDPPRHLAFTWQSDPEQVVEVTFRTDADGTRVTLIHSGWQYAGIQASALSSFSKFVHREMLAIA